MAVIKGRNSALQMEMAKEMKQQSLCNRLALSLKLLDPRVACFGLVANRRLGHSSACG